MFYLHFLALHAQIDHEYETISTALEAVEIPSQNQHRSRLSHYRGPEQMTIGELPAVSMNLEQQANPKKESENCEMKTEPDFG